MPQKYQITCEIIFALIYTNNDMEYLKRTADEWCKGHFTCLPEGLTGDAVCASFSYARL